MKMNVLVTPKGLQFTVVGEEGGPRCEVTHTQTQKMMIFPVSIDRFEEMFRRWATRTIQDAMTDITIEHREFLLTAMTPEDWAKMFPKGDEA